MAVRLREKNMETMGASVNAIKMKDSYTKGLRTCIRVGVSAVR
jgi:hypothetical protein